MEESRRTHTDVLGNFIVLFLRKMGALLTDDIAASNIPDRHPAVGQIVVLTKGKIGAGLWITHRGILPKQRSPSAVLSHRVQFSSQLVKPYYVSASGRGMNKASTSSTISAINDLSSI
jgi:hypothetical protein